MFIFSDDHATQALSAYGGRLAEVAPTPHLDKLAADGILFHRCMVTNSICGPSRASILTGKHSHKNGFMKNRDTFDGAQQTFPKLLQKAGYQTAVIGKWHLKSDPTGFDHWDILPGQGSYYNPDFINAEGRYRVTGYTSEVITEKAKTWMLEQRDSEKPFMLMVQHKAPHREWSPALKYLNAFDDVTIPEPDTLLDDYEGRGTAAREQDMTIEKTMRMHGDLKVKGPNGEPGPLDKLLFKRMNAEQKAVWDAAYEPKNKAFYEANLQGTDLVRWKYQRYLKDYLRCIKSVDDSVGEIRAQLEDMGLADNTIVVYSSDQGFYLGEHGWFDKRFMYDESFRTPLVAVWPGKTPEGSETRGLVSNLDFAQTFLEIGGVAEPEDMQGRSLVPFLKGEDPQNWREGLYYHYYEFPGPHSVKRHEGAYDGRYKLMHFYDIDEWEFYDLKNDPQEMQNQYSNPEYAAAVETMKGQLGRLKEQYDVPAEPPAQVVRKKKKKKK
ncbi:MAG: sulfatase family protein [Opitutales bacterium]